MGSLDDLVIVSCRAAREFVTDLIEKVNLGEYARREGKVHVAQFSITEFAGGEVFPVSQESVRGKRLCVVHLFSQEASELGHDFHKDYMELKIVNDSLRRAGAREITNVLPYIPYLRQERKTSGREPITAKLIIDEIFNSIAPVPARLISVDMHVRAIMGFTNYPVDELTARPLWLMYSKNHPTLRQKDNVVTVAADAGALPRTRDYADHLGVGLAVIEKIHQSGGSQALRFIGDVKGKTAVLIEDMIGTGGTLISCAELLRKNGALPRVYAMATHGLFNRRPGQPVPEQRLFEANIRGCHNRLLATDTRVPFSCAPLVAHDETHEIRG
ncbi:ribose-phosphate pyrophosphokinase [Candidatus Woesearchaeota archaeon]|nr:ribose-phosphate pyrophosphokinase [Candidatus Woesearchaeota archaeon]